MTVRQITDDDFCARQGSWQDILLQDSLESLGEGWERLAVVSSLIETGLMVTGGEEDRVGAGTGREDVDSRAGDEGVVAAVMLSGRWGAEMETQVCGEKALS